MKKRLYVIRVIITVIRAMVQKLTTACPVLHICELDHICRLVSSFHDLTGCSWNFICHLI
jgi:hypothetical protein